MPIDLVRPDGSYIGDVAGRLLATNMNPMSLRTNEVLQKEEWLQFDRAVVETAKLRMRGVGDLVSRGLTYPISNAMGTTVLEWQEVSDIEEAQVSMDAVTRGRRDRPLFQSTSIPLPIIHHEFRLSIRVLEASRKLGQPLDTRQATMASRKVAEKIEDILFNGAASLTSGGATLYGYTDFPSANTGTLTQAWDGGDPSGITTIGEVILTDVRAMLSLARADRMHGPFVLYVPVNYTDVMDQDYMPGGVNSGTAKTIRQRVLELEGIEDIRVSDFLGSTKVVMVQMTPDVVQMVEGFQPMAVQWSGQGGLEVHFKVMAIMVPRLFKDYDARCGIVVYTAP